MNSQVRLLQRRQKIGEQIAHCRQVIQGSLVLIKRGCGKSNCRCQKGRKHPAFYLSQRVKRKTRMTYIPSHCQERILQGMGQYKRMKQLIRRLSAVNERIILKGKDES